MHIGLFDLYATGHHIPYAERILSGLEAVSTHDITFITLARNDRYSEFFEQNDVVFLDDSDSPLLEDREVGFTEFASTTIEEFFAGGDADAYDVIHFLYVDDIPGPLWRHCPTTGGPRLVGEVNGVFFKRGTVLRRRYIHPLFLRTLQSPVGKLIDAAIPEKSSHETLWRDLYLYRCLDRGTFDRVLVHSEEADEYVSRLNRRGATPVANVPYPKPETFGNDISKRDARDRLDLPPDDSILLFFGTLRKEKGIDRILQALREYAGPAFTMVIAGPPISVSEEEIETVSRISSVNVVSEVGYVDTPELFYRAADGLVLPYTWEFGKECTSQTFGEACSAHRPVIVPDFGVLGRITEEWNLGMTYDHGSMDNLVAVMETFATEGISYSEEQMERYNERHSYERIATDLVNLYNETG